jgi:hypothetical protein
MLRRLRPTPRRIAVLLAATVGVGAGVGYAASLSVGSWHLWAGSQPLTKAQCTLTGTTSTTNTYVTQSSANSNNSGSTTMLVRSNSSSQDWSFVRFDLSKCPIAIPTSGGADTATLTLFITSTPSSRTLSVTPVLTTWASTLTWNQAQLLTYGAQTTTMATGASGNTAKSATVTVDVDSLIKSPNSSFGWRISDSGTGNATTTFATSADTTASHRPQLVINYEK